MALFRFLFSFELIGVLSFEMDWFPSLKIPDFVLSLFRPIIINSNRYYKRERVGIPEIYKLLERSIRKS